jgi:hypothetical protein
MQHNDPITSDVYVGTFQWTGTSAQAASVGGVDRTYCTDYTNSFGWHGCCGFTQFGGVPNPAHGWATGLIHTIDKNGVYASPPVQAITKKEMYLRIKT